MIEKQKKMIQNKFPRTFRVAKRVFRYLRGLPLEPEVLTESQAQEIYEQYLESTIYYRNAPLMKEAFNNEYFVHSGPFCGMRYIPQSSGSAFLPKIVGSYEEPIQQWVEEIIFSAERYHTILNVGCAEGYYAVGFALRMPNIHIVAYDVNVVAREKVHKMIEMNGVKNVIVETKCTFEELNGKSQKGTLVLCDIEGAEKALLDPAMAPSLLAADILVECHDCVEPGITDVLIERFYRTHTIRMVVDYPARVKQYKIPNQVSSADYDELINEHRADAMRWLYMKSLS